MVSVRVRPNSHGSNNLANRTTRARHILDCSCEVCHDNFQLRPSSSHSETHFPFPLQTIVVVREEVTGFCSIISSLEPVSSSLGTTMHLEGWSIGLCLRRKASDQHNEEPIFHITDYLNEVSVGVQIHT